MPATVKAIIDVLRPIRDPDGGVSILELGMLRHVELLDGGRAVRIRLWRPRPDSALAAVLEDAVLRAALTVPDVQQADVELVDEESKAPAGPPPPEEETRAAILLALHPVLDPETGTSIVELGFVREVRLEDVGDGWGVDVRMTLTNPRAPEGPRIVNDALERVLEVPGVAEADVQLVGPPRTVDFSDLDEPEPAPAASLDVTEGAQRFRLPEPWRMGAPRTGEELTVDDVVAALYAVADPEMDISIVELGLLRDIQVGDAGRRVDVKLTLTSPACPLAPELMAAVKLACLRITGVEQASVDLVWSPPWDPRVDASEDARAELGIW